MLETLDVVLNRQFTAQEANANKTAKKLREYSFLSGSASDVESDLHFEESVLHLYTIEEELI